MSSSCGFAFHGPSRTGRATRVRSSSGFFVDHFSFIAGLLLAFMIWQQWACGDGKENSFCASAVLINKFEERENGQQ